MGIRTWCPCCGQRYPVRARLPGPGHFYGTMPAVLRRMHRVTFRCCHGAVRGSLRRRADRKQRSSHPRLLVFFIFQLAEVGNMLYTLNKTRVSVRIVLTDHAHQVCGKNKLLARHIKHTFPATQDGLQKSHGFQMPGYNNTPPASNKASWASLHRVGDDTGLA